MSSTVDKGIIFGEDDVCVEGLKNNKLKEKTISWQRDSLNTRFPKKGW